MKKSLSLIAIHVLSLATAFPEAPIRPDALGYNNNFIRGGTWTDPDIVAAFKSLSPGNVRYPAGTLANYWDWRRGGIDTSLPDLPHGWKNTRAKTYGLRELKIACEATGATPVWVLNMLHSDLKEQLAMLREARDLDLPVTCVELGNEYYLQSPAYVARFPTAQDYAAEASRWSVAIKAEFPQAETAAVGAAVRRGDDARRTTWNAKVIPLLKGVDAVTFHIYQGSGLGNPDMLMEAAGLVKEDGPPKKGMWGTRNAQQVQWDVFQTDKGLRNMLSMPTARVAEMKELELLPPGTKAWITEYNLFDRTGPIRGTWAHGLVAAELALKLAGDERVALTCFHDTYGDPVFAAIFNNSKGFDGLLVEEPPPTVPNALTASGRALRLLGRAIHGMTLMEKLDFPYNPMLQGRIPYEALTGYTFSGPRGRSAAIINFSDKQMKIAQVNFPEWAENANATILSGDPRSYVTGPGSLEETTTTFSKSLALPPYSIVLLESDG